MTWDLFHPSRPTLSGSQSVFGSVTVPSKPTAKEFFLNFSQGSQPSGVAWRGPAGGLPRAPDGTGQQSAVRPGRPQGKKAILGQDGGTYRARHVSSEKGGEWTAWDCRGRSVIVRTAGDGRGRQE